MSPRRRASPGALVWLLLALALALVTALAGCTADRSVLDDQACHSDADCESDRLCGPDGFCVLADAISDGCDRACTEHEVCDVSTGSCLCATADDAAACASDDVCCASGCQDLSSDPAHCGGCGVTCGEGEVCDDGVCTCGDDTGAGGPACDGALICCAGSCTDPRFDSGCCGDARVDCAGAPCSGGVCVCPTGTASCDVATPASCEIDLLSDPANCGACGEDCGELTCVGGSCLCAGGLCAEGEQCCGGDCLSDADLATSPRHCGACGNACPPNHDCVDGVCSCGAAGPCAAGDLCCGPPGARQCVAAGDPLCVCGETPDCAQTCCDDTVCTDLDTDLAHCGACGNACGAAQRCDLGVCECEVDALTVCGGECRDLTTDEGHCGGCGVACGSGERCCGGSCVKTSTSNAHCGACFATCTGAGCSSGLCTCSLSPIDLTTSINNCGGCGVRCNRTNLTGAACVDARCDYAAASCNPGWGDCVDDMATDGCETRVSTDELHCGACGNACAADQRCFEGVCLERGEVVAVAASEQFSCALRSTGIVECWGTNNDGQLGDGTSTQQLVPVHVPGVLAVDLDVGREHACVVTQSDEVWCWGRDNEGTLGPLATAGQSPPVHVPLAGPASAVTAGDRHSCAVVDRSASGGAAGEVWCWGSGNDGALGDGQQQKTPTPVRATGLTGTVAIDAGVQTTCAVTAGGALWCWGSSNNGLLGIDTGCTSGDQLTPCEIVAVTSATDVALTQRAIFAVTTAGEVYGWGDAIDNLVLGGSRVPSVIATGFVDVATGGTTACARTATGGAQCWGSHKEGRGGAGPDTPDVLAMPTQVVGLTSGVVDLTVGTDHACAALGAAGAVCWGRNDHGQLGTGDQMQADVPMPVVALP